MAASARTTKGDPEIPSSGVIHQKLRLELIQHAGYLVMGLRCVFLPFLMDPDKTLQRFVLYRYLLLTIVSTFRGNNNILAEKRV